MSSAINRGAASTFSTQGFEQSDRNPSIANWEGDGGPIAVPTATESRVTKAGAGPSADAGLVNYNDEDSADAVENEAEREG